MRDITTGKELTDKEVKVGINILDEKYNNFTKWLDKIGEIRGEESVLSIMQIKKMLGFLDDMEHKIDEVILKAIGPEKGK